MTYRYPTAVSGWDDEEHEALQRVIASGKFTMAEECEALEAEFAAFHGMKHAIGVNSGSSANLVAVAALFHCGFRPTTIGTITIPALAWATTYAPFMQHGFELQLVDVDASWNTSLPTDVVVNILGNPVEKAFNPLLVDNCESIGARHPDDSLAGTQGIINTFSFYYSHQISAVEGGMILTNDDSMAKICCMLRNHGWSRGITLPASFGDEYRFELPGYNVRPVEMHSAVARVQLRKLPQRIAARVANFSHFLKASASLPIVTPDLHGSPSPFGLHFCVASREVRERAAKALRAQGIDCRPAVGGSFRMQPYGARWRDQQTPMADYIHDCGMMLGNPPYEAFGLIDEAIDVLKKVL